MSVKKQSRYARRTSASIRRSKKIPVIIGVAAFIVLTVAAAVFTGNMLKKKADNYTPEDDRYTVPVQLPQFSHKDTRNVLAYAYTLGSDASANAAGGINEFSACLRYPDFGLAYSSEVCRYMGADDIKKEVSLSESAGYIHSLGGYLCGYMYMDAFGNYPESILRIKRAYEISLVREAAECGTDDILLIGIDVNEKNVDDVVLFISEIKKNPADARIGILIDSETMRKTHDGIYIAGKLQKVCDYIALDLRGIQTEQDTASTGNETNNTENHSGETQINSLEKLLEQMDYYIKAYSLRLVFGKNDTESCQKAIDLGYDNCQMTVE